MFLMKQYTSDNMLKIFVSKVPEGKASLRQQNGNPRDPGNESLGSAHVLKIRR